MTDARQGDQQDARDHIAIAEARSTLAVLSLEDIAKTRAAEKSERLQEIMWTHLLRRPVLNEIIGYHNPSDVICYLNEIPLETLLSSVGVTYDGFQRRGRDSVVDSALLDSIRRVGFGRSSTITICEIPWGPAEVAEVQQQGLKEAHWAPPQLLARCAQHFSPGCWGTLWEWNENVCEMHERRFAIIDGFKRLTAIDILRRENKDTWEHFSLMCCVVDISLCHVWQRKSRVYG